MTDRDGWPEEPDEEIKKVSEKSLEGAKEYLPDTDKDSELPTVANLWISHKGVETCFRTGKEKMTEKVMDERTAKVEPLVRRKDAEQKVEDQEPIAWLCPQGGEVFKDFISNDRKEEDLFRCPNCGKLKAKIEAQPEIDHHISLVSQEKLLEEVQNQ